MENNRGSDAPSCSVGSARAPRNASADAAAADNDQQLQAPQEHNIFGDSNLNMVMVFMLVLHFMQYAMRPPCGC
ncbi:hypothetical protein Poli38472_008643 [Pythium oligandrum]|uniref:Uncharacterized protein n=1 Tax=Pythium oligandrum TaxID=41045 RepID=A0A8K1FA84_PYTOL|nr:hypothetical protein Poli38472_008643 [Pythium oligandrum]|eukprot:TMW55995.1 hypothetical protein Poli38472_008643 [Pythium oligandrum]